MLDEIVRQKRKELEAAQAKLPLAELKERLRAHKPERSFREALAGAERLALIAELKRRSPSKGLLRERFDPVSLAQEMEQAGASALSVLTDETFFNGSLAYLRQAKQFTELPVLRKDFILDPYQVYEGVWNGADAVLLIARILAPEVLRACLRTCETLGIDALVEVHDESDLKAALAAGARIVGINHRDLTTFKIDLSLSERLMAQVPKDVIAVAESGLHSAEDVNRMRRLGVRALLIGEALMTAPSVSGKIRELFQLVW